MQTANNFQEEGRPQLMRRRSSIEFKVSQEATPSRRGKTMFLSVIRSSTLAFVTSVFCAYAWLVTIGVGSSYMTFSLIESSQDTLLAFKRDQLELRGALEDLKTKTQIAREELETSTTTCLIEHALHSGTNDVSPFPTLPLCELEEVGQDDIL